jgi:Fibronectin type III domain
MARFGPAVAAAATLLALGAVWPAVALADTTTTTPTTTSTGSSGSGSVIDLGSAGQVVFIVLVIVFFAGLWFALIFYDRLSASRRIYTLLPVLVKAAGGDDPSHPLSAKDLAALTSAVRTQPRSTRGLTRTTIALVLVTLVGIALTALLVGNGNNASDLLKSVVTALTTALTVVIGFYFGAKTATDAAAGAGGGGGSGTRPAQMVPGAPSVTGVETADGQATVTFTAPTTGDVPIYGYTVTAYQGDTAFTTSLGGVSPITVPGLTNGTEYTFTVYATNIAGNGPESEKSAPVTVGPTSDAGQGSNQATNAE